MIRNRVYHSADLPTAEPEGRELRTAPRIKCNDPIDLQFDEGEATARLIDLSTTGVAVSYDGKLELGEVLQMSFGVPGKEDADGIACTGLVRGLRSGALGSVYGLEFHNLSTGDRQRLAEHIRWVRSGGEIAEARDHWSHNPDPGAASVVPSTLDPDRKVLRWVPGFGSLFSEIAEHLLDNDNVFVPVMEAGLYEGEILYLELIPPQSHVLFRSLVEVTWVQAGEKPGVGLRLPTLTSFDREVLDAARERIGEPMALS